MKLTGQSESAGRLRNAMNRAFCAPGRGMPILHLGYPRRQLMPRLSASNVAFAVSSGRRPADKGSPTITGLTSDLPISLRPQNLPKNADVGRSSPAALSAEVPKECSGAGYHPPPQRKSPHDHFHIHVVMSAPTFYGTLRQILSWCLWCGQSEVLGSFLKSKIPSLVAKLLHDKAVYIIVA